MDFADDFAGGGALLGGLERSDGSYLNTLSASSIATLLTCPEQFRISYMNLKWGKPTPAMTLGWAYHYALQRNVEQKVFSSVDMPFENLHKHYSDGWQQAVEREEIRWYDEKQEDVYWLGVEMLRKYHATLSPLVQPIGVEEWFERPIAGVPVPLVGRADIIESGRLIDRKTQKSGATKARPEWRVQAMAYMLAFPGHDFAWHVQAKTGQLRVYAPEKYPGLLMHNTPGKRRAALLLVQEAWGMLEDLVARHGIDKPWPGVGLVNPYACTGCSHRSGCLYWT